MTNATNPEPAVVFPTSNTGADAITIALSLLKTAGIVANSDNYTSPESVVSCLVDVLDMAERFLTAGEAWARDVRNAEAKLSLAEMKRP